MEQDTALVSHEHKVIQAKNDLIRESEKKKKDEANRVVSELTAKADLDRIRQRKEQDLEREMLMTQLKSKLVDEQTIKLLALETAE